MNSTDRVLTALRCQQSDRVPIVEMVIDPKVAKAAVPDRQDVADCMDKLDMDCVSCGVLFSPVEDREDGTWVDEWGVIYKSGPEVVAHPVCGPISSMDDLRGYNPPDPNGPDRLGELPELVRRYKGADVQLGKGLTRPSKKVEHLHRQLIRVLPAVPLIRPKYHAII